MDSLETLRSLVNLENLEESTYSAVLLLWIWKLTEEEEHGLNELRLIDQPPLFPTDRLDLMSTLSEEHANAVRTSRMNQFGPDLDQRQKTLINTEMVHIRGATVFYRFRYILKDNPAKI